MSDHDHADEAPLTPMHDALLAAVAQQSASAAASADRLAVAAEALRHAYQFTRRMKATLLVGGVVSVLLLVVVAALLVLSVQNHQVITTIKDCTSDGGQCFQESQARTSAAVASIIAADVRGYEEVVVCASSPSVISAQTADSDDAYYKALVACVDKRYHP